MDAAGDEFFRVEILESEVIQLADKFRRDPVDSESNQFLRIDILNACRVNVMHEFRRDSMDAKGDEFLGIRGANARGIQALHKFRGDSVDAKGNQFVGLQFVHAGGMDIAKECRAHTVNAKRYEFVSVKACYSCSFDIANEGETDIMDGIGKKIVICHSREAEIGHFATVFSVTAESKKPRTGAIFEKAFCLERAGVACDGEMYIVLAGAAPIEAFEIGGIPIGTAAIGMIAISFAMQEEPDLSEDLRTD